MSVHTFYRQFHEFYQVTPAKFLSNRQLFDPDQPPEDGTPQDPKRKRGGNRK
jgi:hypothetical protein